MIEDVFNHLRIDNRIETGGQPTAEQFDDIATAGHQAVINLALSTSGNAIPNEGELVANHGMVYVHLPVDFRNPNRTNYETFRDIMNVFAERKVFIHCAMNMRVSAFVYVYRVQQQGIDNETALADLHRLWEPDKVWQQLIDTVSADNK